MTGPIRIAVIGLAILALGRDARADSSLVQSPTFRQPERGSLTGSLAKFSIGAEDASRGSFSLGLPVELPTERGAMLADVLPSYSPEHGISEWGAGWSADISIQRFRLRGDVNYQDDDFTSPWGRLQQGSDGAYYAVGMRSATRVLRRVDGWTAIDPAGTRYEFARALTTPSGVYAWYLTDVRTVLGDVTTVEYVSGADGRPFVVRVFHGGPEGPATYRINLEYQTLSVALVDYRSGHPDRLDRRVTGIVVSAKENGTGAYRRRWRYDLTYREDLFGPAFRLESVIRTLASGDAEPPITYDYDLPEQATPTGIAFATGVLEAAPQLGALLDETGDPDGIQYDHAASIDLDEDGLPDIEHGYDFTAYRQLEDGSFAAQVLPPLPPGGDPHCRPGDASISRARTLVRMAGPEADLQVLLLEPLSSTTTIRVCSREGLPLFGVSVPGLWNLGENIKLADLNRDDKPDLLQVDTGQLVVLENVSSEGAPVGFAAHPPIELSYVFGFPFTPSGTWAQDMNGDGNPDLIQRTSDRLSIWYGSGRFGFDVMEHPLPVLNRVGNEVTTLDDWELTWVDANKDGLTDALMAFGTESYLFINEGDRFQEVAVPVLDEANLFHLGVPIIGDYRARGDLDLNFVGLDTEAATLSGPSTGLLTTADDGRGTVVRFEYERAAPAPGLRQRPSVLRSVTTSTGGYDDLTITYGYQGPAMHTVGHFLIGFGNVQSSGPVTTTSVDFYNDDQVTAQVDTRRILDARTPGLLQFDRNTYEEALHAGIRLRRPKTTTSGWCNGGDVGACLSGGAAAVETSEVLAYQRGVCPTRVRSITSHGTLERLTTLASPAALADALHCESGGVVTTGTHQDASLNFRLEGQRTLNDLGQPTQVRQIAGAETLVLQDLTYDPSTHRLATMASPGGGVHTFSFAAATGQLQSITSPDGVVASVQDRDARMDAILAMRSDRGAGGALVSFFRYDGLERLVRTWTDFGGSSDGQPLESVAYQFPTTDFPGLVESSALIDAAVSSRTQEATWTYPDGAALSTATRVPDGWVVGPVARQSRTELVQRVHRRAPLRTSDDVGLQSYSSLLEGSTVLDETTVAGFGHAVSTRTIVQQGVERATTTTLALSSRLLVTTERENATYETKRATDVGGRVIWVRDQSNATTQFKYDALGRLIGVTLADGTRQTMTYDAHGRPSRVHRDRLGDIEYAYEPVTGRLQTKSYLDADGELERTVTFHHDDIGRVIEREHELGSGGSATRYTFRYDGETNAATIPGQKGYTTQIQGPAHTTTVVHNPDGSEASSSIDLAGWMKVVSTTSYYAGGQVKEARRVITRIADGVAVDDVLTRNTYDAWGRLHQTTVNGDLLAELHYDDNGQLAWVALPDGQRIDHLYDPTTLRQTGFSQQIADDGGSRQTGQDWTYNDRELIASEAFDIGDQSWLREYRYDPRGFLTRSEDADELATYSYTTTGLPKQVTDEQGTRSVNRGVARQLTVGGVPYVWDASGRVIQRGQTTFDYGADGNLSVAHAGVETFVYHHDADDNRILKYHHGLPVAAYIGGGYLTETGYLSPVHIGGRVAGVLDHGELHLLATDSRGTLLADRDGTPRLASPYGVRATRPDLSVALDYVEKAYDPDLASVRMGVRDYDPFLGQFWTPDPLFQEVIGKCAESPVDCNLVGYVRNNPVSLTDPDGLQPTNEKMNADWIQFTSKHRRAPGGVPGGSRGTRQEELAGSPDGADGTGLAGGNPRGDPEGTPGASNTVGLFDAPSWSLGVWNVRVDIDTKKAFEGAMILAAVISAGVSGAKGALGVTRIVLESTGLVRRPGSVRVLAKALRKEIDYANELADKGYNVVVRGKGAPGSDFLIDGIRWEYKQLEAATVNAVRKNLSKGLKQGAGRAIIDGRAAGLSHGTAIRAVVQHEASGRMTNAIEVRIISTTGEYRWTR